MKKPHTVIVRQPATWVAIAALMTALLVFAGPALAASTNPATTRPALTASCVPDPNSFRAFDLPNDDGTRTIVQWAKPAEEPEGVAYVVQIARSKADFQAGRFKTKEVSPSPNILASTKPNYFGYSEETKGLYYTVITPAELFEPNQPGPLTEQRLRDFADKDVITPSQLSRALSAIRLLSQPAPTIKPTTIPAAPKLPKLTAAQQADLKWYQSLAAYLTKLDAEQVAAETSRINSATYFFRLGVSLDDQVALVLGDGEPVVVEARAKASLFKWGRLNNLILSLIFMAIVVTFIEIARRSPGMFIRKIAGLEAIDEAIGRATEMDRPVMFVHGGGTVNSMSVIASLNILSHVAYRAAEHDTRIRVMNQDPLVTAVSQEAVQQACTEAGRPDAFSADNVSLVASDQFSYVAAVSGIMVREQPGAIFMLGAFGAESLLLSETGSATGAIQVAGTDSYTQLPFFVTTCDYTLMGEELYAASAYLSREPRMLGSLRGQDVGKAFVMIVLLAGTAVLTVAAAADWPWQWLRGLLEAAG